ncbi:MAG: MFS transporter, partial [Planctomycetes bacterium]|nr:MFS transporter [Planctomycetota bacterium]
MSIARLALESQPFSVSPDPPFLMKPPSTLFHEDQLGSPAKRKTLPSKLPGTAVVYDRTFWFCYLANCSLMMAVSLLFRYADFVKYLGGSEMDLGLIVGVGMFGALATRVLQGLGIDRFGARRIWILSVCLFAISALFHLTVSRVDGPGIYLARILLTTSIAGAFGSS